MEATPVEAMQQESRLRLPQDLLASTGFLLGRIGLAIKGRAMAGFAAEGFTPYDFGVLALLAEGATETQATIADALRVDRSQLVGVLDGLEERGLVERRRDPHDRRRQMVSLTPAGRKALVTLRGIVSRVEDDFLSSLEPAERQSLHELLLRLTRHLDPRCVPDDLPA